MTCGRLPVGGCLLEIDHDGPCDPPGRRSKTSVSVTPASELHIYENDDVALGYRFVHMGEITWSVEFERVAGMSWRVLVTKEMIVAHLLLDDELSTVENRIVIVKLYDIPMGAADAIRDEYSVNDSSVLMVRR